MKDRDYYVDAVMGVWKPNKRKNTKQALCFKREATVKLHKDYAMDYIDPTDFEQYKVYGEVVLTEEKLVSLMTSEQNFFRGMKLTLGSVKEKKIK